MGCASVRDGIGGCVVSSTGGATEGRGGTEAARDCTGADVLCRACSSAWSFAMLWPTCSCLAASCCCLTASCSSCCCAATSCCCLTASSELMPCANASSCLLTSGDMAVAAATGAGGAAM